jgi:hypothetical protein
MALPSIIDKMHFSENTKLVNLLTAIPSAVAVCHGFHMPIDGNGEKTLQELCAQYDTTFEAFLQAVNTLDWEGEYIP